MVNNETVLDNPVWFSLTEKQHDAMMDFGNVKFYHPDYAPFGAFIDNEDTALAIEKYAQSITKFFIIGEKPNVPEHFKPPAKHVGLQMIIYNKITRPITETIIELKNIHYNDLIELIKLVYPHFFKPKTNTLGRYYGIFKDEKLVAVAGERMQTNDFIEISAVATHPNHVGNGYAKQLITHAVNIIFNEGKTPFLHVDQNNLGPLELYKKLGFVLRRKIHYWEIAR